MSTGKESVDFEFFDTPRNDDQVHRVPHIVVEKRQTPKRSVEKNGHISSDSYTSDSDSYTDSSDSEDETARSKEYRPVRKNEQVVVKKKLNSDTDSGSSSAYSYGSDSEDGSPRRRKNTNKNDHSPQRQAWDMNGSAKNDRYERDSRPKSAKLRGRPKGNSRSGSDSDSEITDVSPLNSPRSTPTRTKKQGHDRVQYTSSKEQSGDSEIQLQNDKIDLNLLMQAVSEIDKQERLKANTRRVMFEPQKSKAGQKNHFSFSKGRVTDIEKENQRLLRQIMQQIGPKQKRAQPKVSYPVARIDRLTSSAVNRRRHQSQIEQENMVIISLICYNLQSLHLSMHRLQGLLKSFCFHRKTRNGNLQFVPKMSASLSKVYKSFHIHCI